MPEREDEFEGQDPTDSGQGDNTVSSQTDSQDQDSKDGDLGFWKEYPDAAMIPAFQEIKKKRPKEASAIMYYIFALNDPNNTFLRHLPRDKREVAIREHYGLKKSSIYTSKGDKLLVVAAAEQWFHENWLSPIEASFAVLNDKLLEGKRIIRDHTLVTWEDLAAFEQMTKALTAFQTEYKKLEAALKSTKPVKVAHAGQKLSAAARGALFRDV